MDIHNRTEVSSTLCIGCHLGPGCAGLGDYYILGGRNVSYPYHKSCAEDALATLQITLETNERLRQCLSRLLAAAAKQPANSIVWKQTFNILADMDQELAVLAKDYPKL